MEFREWMDAARPGADVLEAADEVNYAFLFANRALDTVKEKLWIEHGMPMTSDYIHALAHVNLNRLDSFGDILHEKHLEQTYPATPALEEEISDVDKAFAVSVEIVDRVDAALRRFIGTTNIGDFSSMARSAETIQMANSADRLNLLKVWQMWDDSRSKTSFESWVFHVTGDLESEGDDDD